MRSVNVTYKIYEFSELSEDAKAKVKKWYLDNLSQKIVLQKKRKGRFVAMQKSVAGKLLYLKITVILIV